MEEQKTQLDVQETNLQERLIRTPTDHSLPAAQIIHQQDDQAEQNYSPRFIP